MSTSRLISQQTLLGGVLVYSNTATGGVVANTAAETAFSGFSYSIPASSVQVGDVFEVELRGKYGTDAVVFGTLNLKLKIGSTVLLATGAFTNTGSLVDKGWRCRYLFTVTTIGASGAVVVEGDGGFYTALGTALSVIPQGGTISSIDFTAAQAITATATWSNADADNTITLEQVVIRKLTAAVSSETHGDVFPTTGLYTGRTFFRDALGLACYYDGTRWLTQQEYPVVVNSENGAISVSGPTGRGVKRNDYNWYLTRWSVRTYVSGTNNGTSKWTVELNGIKSDNTADSTISTFSTGTAPDTASTWVTHDQAINAVLSSTAAELQIASTKVSSPGGLYCPGTVWGRLIIT